MKLVRVIILFSIIILNRSSPSEDLNPQNRAIYLQPLDSFGYSRLNEIKNEIAEYWKEKVVVLEPAAIPAFCYSTFLSQYSADSILTWLSNKKGFRKKEVIAITSKNLYTKKKSLDPNISDYFEQGIFGLGYQPGNLCVVSDYKISRLDSSEYMKSILSIILHEMGHNKGLAHCSNQNCLMSEQSGSVFALTKGKNFCEACKLRLRK